MSVLAYVDGDGDEFQLSVSAEGEVAEGNPLTLRVIQHTNDAAEASVYIPAEQIGPLIDALLPYRPDALKSVDEIEQFLGT